MSKVTLKLYLCVEHGERFYVEATDLDDAKYSASMWGAEVIGEVPMKYLTINPHTIDLSIVEK